MTMMNGTYPVWVKAIVQLGTPSVIALFLVWWLTGSLSTTLVAHDTEQHQRMEAMTRVMVQICVNTADTIEERTGCFATGLLWPTQ